MNTFKITWSNNDIMITGFNGTLEDAKKYYMKHWFNIGVFPKETMGHAIEVVQID